MSDDIVPYRINADRGQLDDLRTRLERTRWPEPETVTDWSQGVPLAYLRDLCGYWAAGYDWSDREARLNSLPQYRTVIDGLGIHFVHVRAANPDALPLVVTHGWPGSFAQFVDVVGPLTDPERFGGDASDAFHLVLPSLPGYGFSDKPKTPGWGGRKDGDGSITRKAIPVTRSSSPRDHRRSDTAWSTPRLGSARGSSRSSGPGPTQTATR